MTLVPIDPKNEASVVTLLERAATWLAEAVHRGEPGEVAAVKAQMATAAEATKQLGLSKEIQLDAQEMVRRAEYALGKAIRRGQAEGTVLVRGQVASHGNQWRSGADRSHGAISTTEFAPKHELAGTAQKPGIYTLADDVEPEQFEEAVAEAREEGNLSRANVVRKVRGERGNMPTTRQQKAEVIADLAAQGYTSHQMVERVGVTVERVREIARAFDVDLHADRVVGRGGSRIDHTAAVESAVNSLDNWASSLTFIDFTEVDGTQGDEWVASLTNSLTELRRFIKQIKETTHV